MNGVKTKDINFSVLYGVVLKRGKNYLTINYGKGVLRVLLDEIEEDTSSIKPNYTISVSGYLKQGWIRTNIVAQNISIFDKNPHFINLDN